MPKYASGCRRAPGWHCSPRRVPGRCSSGRAYVIPEDMQAVFVAVAAHRLIPARGSDRDALARRLLAETAVE